MQLAEIQPIPETWAARVIERLHLLYGSKFMQQWDGIDKATMVRAWAEQLAGFAGDDVSAGLAACGNRPFAPTLPEFKRLCRPWLEPEVAFRMAVTGMQSRRAGEIGAWPHPAVYWAAVEIGNHDMLNQSWQTLKSRWEAAYSIQLARQSWDEIQAPAAALPAPGRATATKEQADAGIKAMAAAAIEKPRDPKAWAKKILANPKAYASIAVTMAKRALGEEVAA